MNKTALTEILEYLDLLLKENEKLPNDQQFLANIAIETVITKAIALLQKEREDIEQAYIFGLRNGGSIKAFEIHEKWAKEYFETNFTQYNPKPTP